MPAFLSLSFLGFTFDVIGKLLIAYVTLRIHVKHFRKHHVDRRDLRLDVVLSGVGIAMIAIGYAMRTPLELGLVELSI